ncbi:MAG: ferredoxin [Deltaproteobacteria bacterium]|nr:ferredoxin [Deltaproteobacteria bacterium]
MRVRVDADLCQGHGACKSEAPEVFDVNERDGVVIVLQVNPSEALRAKVQAAVRYCPTRALALEE